MSSRMYFLRECPTCGRHLHIRVEYLGKKVVCPHCHGELEACDPTGPGFPPCCETTESLIRRADELLESGADSGVHARVARPR